MIPRAHPLEWVYLAVGLVGVWRNFFLFDDAFVYFRYVDNLLFLDLGLVYNQGEYVEGYTSPLWTLLLAALRASELSWSALVRGASLAGFAAFWWLGVRVHRALSPPGVTVDLPLAWLAGLYGVTAWFSSGSETPWVQLLAPAYALFVLRPGSLPLQLLVGLSPLVRHELAPSCAVVLAWAFTRDRRAAARLLAVAAVSGGAWLAFRVTYYADLLPNTFYLKSAWDPRQGLAYLHDSLGPYQLYPLGAVLLGLALALGARGGVPRLAERAAMLAAALPVAAYAVAVGGTSTHYRFLAFPICLSLLAAGGLVERAILVWAPRAARFAWVLGLALVAGAASLRPWQHEAPRFNVDHIADAAYHRARIGDGGAHTRDVSPARLREHRRAHPETVYRDVRVVAWCARAYRAFDHRVVHRYGLTDAVLARADAPTWRPGHPGARVREMARDLARIHERALADGRRPAPGLLAAAAREDGAPDWIARNAETLALLERKIYNRHDLSENLALALRFPARVR